MEAGEVERVVAVDWSGRIDLPGQRKHIWAGVWTAGQARKKATIRLEAGRSRDELTTWLIELAAETPRMAVSIDCCFSYPAWFLQEHGCSTVVDFWRHVAAGHGERWLRRESQDNIPRDERFWGKPHKRPQQFCGEHLPRMMRRTDMENKILPRLEGGDSERAAKMLGITPKSPFQIGGSGSVGTGSLRAMPSLLRLHDAGFRIWPFDDAALGATPPHPLLVEMYTRLMTGPVKKSNAEARKLYLQTKRATDPLYADLPRSVLASARLSEDAFDALVSTLVMVQYRAEFLHLPKTSDRILRLEGETWRPGL